MKRPVPKSFDAERVRTFVDRWKNSGASERANAQSFLNELCDVLGVDRPNPKRGESERDTYCFERDVLIIHPDGHTTTNFIDLYKRKHFVLEAKQGSEGLATAAPIIPLKSNKKRGTAVRGTGGYDVAMQDAYAQAERYARALDEWPPFIITCDVGFSFELYGSFDGTGKYRHFPTAQQHRILIDALVEEETFSLLYDVFTDPFARDPARESAKVTREIAGYLAQLAQMLEAEGHEPELVAKFLMRCLFTMFAEDVGLLPLAPGGEKLFTHALREHWTPHPTRFPSEVEALWRAMNAGGALFGVAGKILQFNGGLFVEPVALGLTTQQLQVLQLAAIADWSEVEPAIFGTLLERALDPKERHRLGAHFTPRSYVERLVSATVEEPIRADWNLVRAQVRQLVTGNGQLDVAKKVLREFHAKLVKIRVLDPACGTGNFLYVTLDIFKRIESEVLAELQSLGDNQLLLDVQHVTVNPGQFLGLEIKPWAREIADLVLWIGYLQWHYKTRGRVSPAEPVLSDYKNIVKKDAVLEYDGVVERRDHAGDVVTRWDGHTVKKSPITGEEIPDDSARVPVLAYVRPREATWPQSEFIVGNPPYAGTRRLKEYLGDEYVEELRSAYPDVAQTSDLVMYWWHKAAKEVGQHRARGFGLITTKSITQEYSRPVLEHHLGASGKIALTFAISDHPWEPQTPDSAAVRIAMTAGVSRDAYLGQAQLGTVVRENATTDEVVIEFEPVQNIGSALAGRRSVRDLAVLRANVGICFQGVVPGNKGFKLSAVDVHALGVDLQSLPNVVKKYIIGNDIVRKPKEKYIIDFFGMSDTDAMGTWPALYQHVHDRVLPERRENKRPAYRTNWWLFCESRPKMRRALAGLPRFIVTPYTAQFRPFVFVSADTIPDAMAYAIASEDAFVLGVLSSRVHVLFARKAGGALEDRKRYNSNVTFLPFPFPECGQAMRERIADLAEQLDRHRKRQLKTHPELTLTAMYNVLEKLDAGVELSKKEKTIYEFGLLGIMKALHGLLDAAVLEAYALGADSNDAAILSALLALNSARLEEEARGIVRSIRPDLLVPIESGDLVAPDEEISAAVSDENEDPDADELERANAGAGLRWPDEIPDQLAAIHRLLNSDPRGWSLNEVATRFTSKSPQQRSSRKPRIAQHLSSLEGLGLLLRYRAADDERWHTPDGARPTFAR